jgi:hypothetical protein
MAMLESGQRPLTTPLMRRFMSVYKLSPAFVPCPAQLNRGAFSQDALASDLAGLGYPGFAHLRASRWTPKNPAAVLLAALASEELDARLVEALPWVLLEYPTLDQDWLVQHAKLHDLQNRLGFVTTLARELAQRTGQEEKAAALRVLEDRLERSRLAREETLGRRSVSERAREWVARRRSAAAQRWNVMTDWTVDDLRYGPRSSVPVA